MNGLRVDKNITHWSQYSCAGPPVSDYHESMVAASQAFTEYRVIPKLDIYRSPYNSISLGFKYHRPGLYYYLTNICICLTGSFSRLQLTEVILSLILFRFHIYKRDVDPKICGRHWVLQIPSPWDTPIPFNHGDWSSQSMTQFHNWWVQSEFYCHMNVRMS